MPKNEENYYIQKIFSGLGHDPFGFWLIFL